MNEELFMVLFPIVLVVVVFVVSRIPEIGIAVFVAMFYYREDIVDMANEIVFAPEFLGGLVAIITSTRLYAVFVIVGIILSLYRIWSRRKLEA